MLGKPHPRDGFVKLALVDKFRQTCKAALYKFGYSSQTQAPQANWSPGEFLG